MALEKQILEWKAGSGVDTKTDAKLVETNLISLENAVFTKSQSIQKRPGLLDFGGQDTTGISINEPTGIAVFNDELIQFANRKTYAYTASLNKMIPKGNLDNVSLSTESVISNNYAQTSPDAATLNGVTIYVWEDSTTTACYYYVIDEMSGSILVPSTLLVASSVLPKVIACGVYFFIYYIVGTSLISRRISSNTPTIIEAAVVTLNAGLSATKLYDVIPNGSNMLVVYKKSNTYAEVSYVGQDGLKGTGTNALPLPVETTMVPTLALTLIAGTSGIYAIGYDTTAGLTVYAYYYDFSVLSTNHVVDATLTYNTPIITAVDVTVPTTGHPDYVSVMIYYTVLDTPTYKNMIRTVEYKGAVASVATSIFKRSVALASKAFLYNGYIYFNTVYTSLLQTTYFLLRSDGHIVARAFTGVSGAPSKPILPGVPTLATGSYLLPALLKGVLNSESGTLFTNTGVAKINIEFNTTVPTTAQLGQNLHISGGVLRDYDGTAAVEHGFHLFPEPLVTIANSGGNIAAGAYQYIVVWEWIDGKGQMHRSAPSIPGTGTGIITTTGTGLTTLVIPTLKLSDKTNISVAVYRTAVSGLIFYKVTSASIPVLNDITADSITVTDGLIDSAITSNELLYTTGGVLGNDVPPASSHVTVYNNRIWLVTDKENQLAYSKTYGLGNAVDFSDYLTLQVESRGGKIVATKVLDDKLIIFKNKSIFFITGNGPTNTGDSNDLTIPQLIPSDVGLSDVNSVVLTPQGLMFKSIKGIHLLDHSMHVIYIGAMVEAFNNLTIKAAVSLDLVKEVRFITESVVLVYNYYFGQWSTFTYGGLDAVNWQGSFILAKTTGYLTTEMPNYKDNGQTYSQKLITPWFKMGHIQGYGRLWRIFLLGNFKSNHTLRVRISYNYSSVYSDNFVITTNSIFSGYWGSGSNWGSNTGWGNEDSVYQFRIDPSIQLCESFQLTIEDLQGEESYTLEALSFEIGVRSGAIRIGSGKTL